MTGFDLGPAVAEALGGELAFIADCGHYPWIEQPDAFRRLADGWLAVRRRPAG